MSALLEIEGLRVRIDGRDLLEVDDLRVEAGTLAVVLGNAGSGKSLLAGALCGDIAFTGQIRVDGRALSGDPSRRARMGLAASVRDGQRVAGCTVREALNIAANGGPRAAEALERVPQLASRADLAAERLSGGEQQLLQVACAWCASPRVLVLDSPTVGLASDAADILSSIALAEAAAGASVLWLEQEQRAAPGPPTGVLVRGRLSPVSAEGSSASGVSAGESPPGPGRTP